MMASSEARRIPQVGMILFKGSRGPGRCATARRAYGIRRERTEPGELVESIRGLLPLGQGRQGEHDAPHARPRVPLQVPGLDGLAEHTVVTGTSLPAASPAARPASAPPACPTPSCRVEAGVAEPGDPAGGPPPAASDVGRRAGLVRRLGPRRDRAEVHVLTVGLRLLLGPELDHRPDALVRRL